jgi:hypothetical protein
MKLVSAAPTKGLPFLSIAWLWQVFCASAVPATAPKTNNSAERMIVFKLPPCLAMHAKLRPTH